MHTVSIQSDQIIIGQHVVTFPLPLDTVKGIFGPDAVSNKAKFNTIYTWHALGVYAYSKDETVVDGIAFEIKKEKTYKFLPTSIFQGAITLAGVPLQAYTLTKKKPTDTHAQWIAGDTMVFLDLNDQDEILTVEISRYVPEVIPEPDRYAFKAIEGKPMQFKDLNFKLAVIQVLMYEKELIQPAFDIFEFAKRHKARTIDVDSEGYDIIPEALQYFEQLQIDERLAPEVDALTQDGGNDIYMNIIPFWSGSTDDFNIQSFEDVDQFPNLKTIVLFYDVRLEEIQAEMKKKGIEVDPL
jgi:hypothetical protein